MWTILFADEMSVGGIVGTVVASLGGLFGSGGGIYLFFKWLADREAKHESDKAALRVEVAHEKDAQLSRREDENDALRLDLKQLREANAVKDASSMAKVLECESLKARIAELEREIAPRGTRP